jgi:hypothetical protein
LYRVPGVGALPDDVRVDDGGISFPLQETIYRARGYKPLIDDLPWEKDYLSPTGFREMAPGSRHPVSFTKFPNGDGRQGCRPPAILPLLSEAGRLGRAGLPTSTGER